MKDYFKKTRQGILSRLWKNESGQSTVLFAVALTVLFGCSALVTDLGTEYVAKNRMQTAADMAASSGALSLGTPSEARIVALDIAEANGADRSMVVVNTPYDGDANKIEVICYKQVDFTFAKVLGIDSKVVSGRAVAKRNNAWYGEALPFLNMDGHYWEDGIILSIWDKSNNGSNPGNFERIADYDDKLAKAYWKMKSNYFEIDYTQGIGIANGKKAYVKDFVETLYSSSDHAYLFSLTQEAIESGRYDRTRNKQVVPLQDLCLIRVGLESYAANGKGGKILYVSVEEVYDIRNGQYPTTFIRGSGSSSLVE